MLSEVKKRYAQSLERSKLYLEANNTTAKATSITSTRELCLLRNEAECPICGIKFVGKNHNTEHIHPRSLGGLNKDENKIQMCTACNNARNLTMQGLLGNPPYYKNYQQIKTDVDDFILWSELTADDGLAAGVIFLRIQELFCMARFANDIPPMPQRAYGRFSTWDKDDFPNHKINKKRQESLPIEHNKSVRKPGVVVRFLDRLFGYQPPKPVVSSNSENLSNNTNSSMVRDINPSNNPKPESQNPQNENSTSNKKRIQHPAKGGYPLITHLNSSSKGIRLPKEPRRFALSLDWFIENAVGFSTFRECIEGMKEAGLVTKSRAIPVLRTILRGYSSEGSFESVSKQDLCVDKTTIVDRISKSLTSSVILIEYITGKEEFLEEIRKYFHAVNREFTENYEGEKFPLLRWLHENWKDGASYPLLRKAITDFENDKGSKRNFRNTIKEDFEIPKSWPVDKIISRINELKA